MNIIIHGICGRMGQSLIACAPAYNLTISGGIDKTPTTINTISVSDDITAISKADMVIDFSVPEATMRLLETAIKTKTPLVIGTTGFDAAQNAAIKKAAEHIAIVKSGNMSLGIALLARLVEQAAQELADWDIEIFEMHHKHKKDAPSGTALLLGAAAAAGRTMDLPPPTTDRTGTRPEGAIGFSVARGGAVIGDHKVGFFTDGESLTLAHRAEDRHIFARGALYAAGWLHNKPAGLYDLHDVIKDKQ